MRLKIEINTREHFSVLDTTRQSFTVDNPWFKGTTELPIYHLDELIAKLPGKPWKGTGT